MTEQVDTQVATAATEAPAHGVLLTDVAASKVKSLLEQEGRDDLRLRVGVQPGGCSGLIYQLYFDERTLDGDLVRRLRRRRGRRRPDERPLPRRRDHRLRRHDREAGLHHRQPQRRQLLRLRRQLQLTVRPQPTPGTRTDEAGTPALQGCRPRAFRRSEPVDAAPRGQRLQCTVRIAVTGSIATDHLMTFTGRFADSLVVEQLDKISLSFLVDDLEVRRGGVAANIAFGMANLGQRPLLVGAVGEDFARLPLLAGAARRRLRSVHVSETRHTARFVCTTDADHAQIATFYAGAMSEAREIELGPIAARVGGLDLVVIGANDPEAMLRHTDECRTRGHPVRRRPEPAARLRWTARRSASSSTAPTYLFTNEYEAALTEQKTGWSAEEIARPRPAPGSSPRARTASSSSAKGEAPIEVPAAREVRKADPTGVGDAFRAGFLTGLAWGLDHRRCAELGSMLATYVIETVGTQEYALGQARFLHRLAEAYGDESAAEIEPHLACAAPLSPSGMPVEPPRPAALARSTLGAAPTPGEDLVGVGADLRAGHPARGLPHRPVPDGRRAGTARRPLGWWSPDPRGVLLPGELRVSRSLRKSPAARSRSRVDTAFDEVVDGVRRPQPGRALDHPARSPTPTPSCTRWAGRTRSRPGATASWSAASTGSRSAACSPASRCSTARPTPPRSRWSRSPSVVFADGDPRRLSTCSGPPPHLAQPRRRRGAARATTCRRLEAALALPLPEPWRAQPVPRRRA